MNQPQVARTAPIAIWSLVLGILGLLCLGPLAAIPAVICGHIGMSRVKAAGGSLGGGGMALAGVITGYVGIALMVFVLPIFAAVAFPALAKARTEAQRHACINNLRQIDAAKQQWVAEHSATPGTPVAEAEVNSLLPDGKAPVCPAKGTYVYGPVGQQPTCTAPRHALDGGLRTLEVPTIPSPDAVEAVAPAH